MKLAELQMPGWRKLDNVGTIWLRAAICLVAATFDRLSSELSSVMMICRQIA